MSRKMNTLRKAFYHLQMAEKNFADVMRENPDTVAERKSKLYLTKLEYIFTDFKSSPLLPSVSLDTFREEMKSDIMFHEAISWKSLDLSPKQKDGIERAVDGLVAGQDQTIVISAG